LAKGSLKKKVDLLEKALDGKINLRAATPP